MNHLNQRRMRLLSFLMEQPVPITVKVLCKQFDCSDRMIRYDLDMLDWWLQSNDLPLLIRRTNVGIRLPLTDAEKERMIQRLNLIPFSHYECSRRERVQFIILQLLSNAKRTIQYFQDHFLCSRGTILQDLKEVERWLSSCYITLKRKPRYGLFIEGTEMDIRHAMTILMKDIQPDITSVISRTDVIPAEVPVRLLKERKTEIYDHLHLHMITEAVIPILKQHQIELSDSGLTSLLIHIAMAVQRLMSTGEIALPADDIACLKGKPHYRIAAFIAKRLESLIDVSLPETEIGYITMHLLGNSHSPVMDGASIAMNEERIRAVVKQMTMRIERLLQLKFPHIEEMQNGLALHLGPAIYRASYGLRTSNPLTEQIKKEYGELFQIVKSASRLVEEQFHMEFDDDEIAYITMHYGSKLIDAQVVEPVRLRVVLVCSSGLGSAVMLKARILTLFEDIHIVDVISYQKLELYNCEKIDMIVSTIPLPVCPVPVLVVSPLLPSEDYKKLEQYIPAKRVRATSSYYIYERLWPIIARHCTIGNHQELTDELLSELSSSIDGREAWTPLTTHSLQYLLNNETVQVGVEADNWEEAILKSVMPLERGGWVTSKYGSRINHILKERGPYMAICPGVMLAHASQNDGVIQVCMSLTRLKRPVRFGHQANDPIRLICTFATPDSNSHIHALNQLMELLMSEVDREALMRARQAMDMLKIIHRFGLRQGVHG